MYAGVILKSTASDIEHKKDTKRALNKNINKRLIATTLSYSNLFVKVNILNCVQQLDSVFHRFLERFASGYKPGPARAFVDNRGGDRIMQVIAAGRSAGIYQSAPSKEAVDDLIPGQRDRIIL